MQDFHERSQMKKREPQQQVSTFDEDEDHIKIYYFVKLIHANE